MVDVKTTAFTERIGGTTDSATSALRLQHSGVVLRRDSEPFDVSLVVCFLVSLILSLTSFFAARLFTLFSASVHVGFATRLTYRRLSFSVKLITGISPCAPGRISLTGCRTDR